MLQIKLSRLGRISLIEAQGRLDGINASQLSRLLTREIQDRHARVILDLAGVDYLSGAGLRVLRNLRDLTGEVHVARPSDRVREVLQIIGLDNVFNIYEERAQAIRAVAPVTNAHTHLELGWLAASCPGVAGLPFVHWIVGIVGELRLLRQGDFEGTYRRSAEEGIQQLLDAGTTTVADFSPLGLSIEPLLESGLSGVVYVELIAPGASIADERFERTREVIERWRPRERNGLRIGIGLHAPYSLPRSLWQKAVDYARREALPVSIHVAESPAEREYLQRGTGLFAERYYEELGFPALPSPGLSPVAYLEALGALALKPLLAHGVQVDDEDIRRIKNSGSSVVHCPRSNLRLRCGRMPLEKYLLMGVPVYLGTDSLGSSPSLDIFDELEAAVALHHGYVEPDVIERLIHQGLPIA